MTNKQIPPELKHQTPEVADFLMDIAAVCKKHGMVLAHEDEHGSFLVKNYQVSIRNWIWRAGNSIKLAVQRVSDKTRVTNTEALKEMEKDIAARLYGVYMKHMHSAAHAPTQEELTTFSHGLGSASAAALMTLAQIKSEQGTPYEERRRMGEFVNAFNTAFVAAFEYAKKARTLQGLQEVEAAARKAGLF